MLVLRTRVTFLWTPRFKSQLRAQVMRAPGMTSLLRTTRKSFAKRAPMVMRWTSGESAPYWTVRSMC